MKRTLQLLIAATMLALIAPVAMAQETRPKIPVDWSVSGFISSQYSYSPSETNTFFIRNARLDLKGCVTDHLEFKLQSEFAGGSVRVLDALMKCKFNKYINIEIGQFKTPFTLESQYHLLKKEGIDYAQVISRLSGYSDILPGNRTNGRDIGVMLYGGFIGMEEDYMLLNYNVGVFNGCGINRKDDNLSKDIIARFDIHPFLKDLVLSASLIRGTYDDGTNPDAANNRFSFGGEYKSDALTIRSEYVRADVETGGVVTTTDGFYAVAGYWLPLQSQIKLRPVLRYDRLNAGGASSVLYMAGLDCWPWSHLRLQVGYTLCTDIPAAASRHLFQAMASVKL